MDADRKRSEEHKPRRATIAESVGELEGRGFEAQFVIKEEQRIRCVACKAEFAAREVHYLKGRRVDFETDPAQQSLVAGLECPSCGVRGTYTFTYGPGADANEAEILRILRAQRAEHGPKR